MATHTADSSDSPTKRPQVGTILLAGGASRRMGAHKLLLPLGDAPIIVHSLRAALGSSASPIILVTGRDSSAVQAAVAHLHPTVVVNDAYDSGLASSLACGLSALPPAVAGALVLLADQPLMPTALINVVCAAAEASPDAIIVAAFHGRRGHPSYFPRSLFGELRAVTGDEGGRSVIARHPDRVLTVAWPDESAILDVDTPDDYARVQAAWIRQREVASG